MRQCYHPAHSTALAWKTFCLNAPPFHKQAVPVSPSCLFEIITICVSIPLVDDGLAVQGSLSATDSVQQLDASGHGSRWPSIEGVSSRHVMHRFRAPSKRNSVSWLIAATLRTCKDSFGECLRQRRLQYSVRTHQMDLAMKSKIVG